MSFPTIPDVDPCIDIDLCDAVNLLLTSIAMEEISLSKLMDAEHDKIQYVLERCESGGCPLEDVVAVNKSADDMLKTMIKLQMLLQFKLENVHELMPCTTTTTTTTTTSTTCTRSTTTKCCRGYCLMGTGKGCIENPCDPFCGFGASLHAFIPCGDRRNRAIRYTVGDECEGLYFYASEVEMESVSPCGTLNGLFLHGIGQLRKFNRTCAEAVGQATYALTIRPADSGRVAFKMQLTSCATPQVNHDSGFINTNGFSSDLHIGVCR